MTAARRATAVRLPPDERRRQLLAVASELFAARGFHDTSMDEVARAAGITKPVIYQHFASKRALFVAVLDDVGRRLLEALTEATEPIASPRVRVQAGFEAYFQFVARNRQAFRILFGSSARNDAEFAQVVDSVVTAAAAAVSHMIQIDGSPEHRNVLAHAIVGMAEAVSRCALADARASLAPEQLAQWATELAWSGLRGVRRDESG